ncbi:hypothetical protein MASR2M15_25780 [Anaerolineales bacterium]
MALILISFTNLAQAQAQDWLPYEHPAFSFYYPANWQIQESQAFVSLIDPLTGANLSIISQELEAPLPIDIQTFGQNLLAYQTQNPDFSFESLPCPPLWGDAYCLHYQHLNRQLITDQILINHGNWLTLITLTTTPTEPTLLQPILDNLHLNPPPLNSWPISPLADYGNIKHPPSIETFTLETLSNLSNLDALMTQINLLSENIPHISKNSTPLSLIVGESYWLSLDIDDTHQTQLLGWLDQGQAYLLRFDTLTTDAELLPHLFHSLRPLKETP